MKSCLSSFLYLFLNCYILFTVDIAFAQDFKNKDSINYYYEVFLNPKKPDDFTRAYKFYQRRFEYHKQKNDTTGMINDLRFMSSIQNNLGLLYESEKTVVQALKLLNSRSQSDTSSAATGLFNELGMIHRALYDYDKALEFYERALSFSQNSRDSIAVLNNIAYTYSKQGKHDLAQLEFEKVYVNSLKQKSKEHVARALNNLGSERAKQNNPEGLKNMLVALTLREELKDTKGLYSSYKHLAEYYHLQKNKEKAMFYAQEAYKVAKSLNSMSFLEDALSNLIDINADPLVLEYKTITDSLAKTKQLQENKFAEMQYNYSEYQRRAQESQLAASEQRSKTLLYQFTGLVILVIGICLFIMLRMRHKKENMLKVYETETRISKKVHDEVANDIYKMMAKLQTTHNSNEPLLDELEEIYVKTRDISKENSDIIHTDFKAQLQDLLRSYQNEDVNVITKGLSLIEWDLISDVKKTTIYRVLQELMTNMKKHSQASLAIVTFKQEKNKLQIMYKDNGIGTELHKGSGCQNMETRMAAIKGFITFESQPENGFKALLIV